MQARPAPCARGLHQQMPRSCAGSLVSQATTANSCRACGIIAKPLTQLLTKKGFTWSTQAQAAFDLLKDAMASTPVLALPDFSRPFSIETDACDTGVGAVLVQDGHPIAYLSKSLGVRNQRVSIYEKEFLVVMMAVDKWRAYLQRAPFIIVTDHKSLCHLGDQQLETELQRKAMSKMVGLQFSFKYRCGADNGAADALSRVGHLLSLDALAVCQPQWLQEFTNSSEQTRTVKIFCNSSRCAVRTIKAMNCVKASFASRTGSGLAPIQPFRPS